jgi:hypothetical protein
VLGISVRRARLVSAHWDFGKVGRNILVCASLLTAALLAFCGLYAVVRFVEIVWRSERAF